MGYIRKYTPNLTCTLRFTILLFLACKINGQSSNGKSSSDGGLEAVYIFLIILCVVSALVIFCCLRCCRKCHKIHKINSTAPGTHQLVSIPVEMGLGDDINRRSRQQDRETVYSIPIDFGGDDGRTMATYPDEPAALINAPANSGTPPMYMTNVNVIATRMLLRLPKNKKPTAAKDAGQEETQPPSYESLFQE